MGSGATSNLLFAVNVIVCRLAPFWRSTKQLLVTNGKALSRGHADKIQVLVIPKIWRFTVPLALVRQKTVLYSLRNCTV